jgi:hypothetical protein
MHGWQEPGLGWGFGAVLRSEGLAMQRFSKEKLLAYLSGVFFPFFIIKHQRKQGMGLGVGHWGRAPIFSPLKKQDH